MNRKYLLFAAIITALLLAGCTDNGNGDGETPSQGASLANFQQTNAACANTDPNRASTSLDVKDTGTVVEVTGTLRTTDPCQELDAELVNTGGNDYELRITSHPTDGMCQQCVGAVSYQATVSFATDTGSVAILHEGEQVSQAQY